MCDFTAYLSITQGDIKYFSHRTLERLDLGLQWQTRLSDLTFFGGGCSSCCSCDRGKTKSTPSLKTKTGLWQKNKLGLS